jgi:hypothetical protein
MQVDNDTVAPNDALFEVVQASLDELARMREMVANGRRVSPARAMITRIKSLALPKSAPAASAAAPARAVAPAPASAPPFFPEPTKPQIPEFDTDIVKRVLRLRPSSRAKSRST